MCSVAENHDSCEHIKKKYCEGQQDRQPCPGAFHVTHRVPRSAKPLLYTSAVRDSRCDPPRQTLLTCSRPHLPQSQSNSGTAIQSVVSRLRLTVLRMEENGAVSRRRLLRCSAAPVYSFA